MQVGIHVQTLSDPKLQQLNYLSSHPHTCHMPLHLRQSTTFYSYNVCMHLHGTFTRFVW